MKFCLFAVVTLFTIVSSFAGGEKMSSDLFLSKVRKPPQRESWAMLDGKVQHKGKSKFNASLYLGLKFTPIQTQAQVVLNNKESWTIGQFYEASKDSCIVTPAKEGGYNPSVLADCGVAPGDLAMSFLYWAFVVELEPASVRSFDSRIFILKSNDYDPKDSADDKYAKVYVSTEYYFPVKVEWFRNDDELKSGKVHRIMEIKSFDKQDDFWLVDELSLYGVGWRTNISFKDSNAGYTKDSVPKKLFRDVN